MHFPDKTDIISNNKGNRQRTILETSKGNCREAPKKQTPERIGSRVETDRQKEGCPTELWRERETAAYVAITNW